LDKLKLIHKWNKCIVYYAFGKAFYSFEKAMTKTSKIHDLFIWYLNSTYLSVLESSL
jgi:hypothetical protein